MMIRDRIRELRRVPASQLIPHPANWRTHPDAQKDALRGILAEVGYADALLARELPDGSLQLIDGHLRAETTPDQEVPVLILDLDEAEAAKLLAVLDPLAALAEVDAAKLHELLAGVETDSEAMRKLMDDLDVADPTGEDEAPTDQAPPPERGTDWDILQGDVQAGCPVGGKVLDPFCGSGTTGVVALRLGRSFLGIELNPEYIQLARKRISESITAEV